MTVYQGQSVLGRFNEVYSEEEKQLCHQVATFLKKRYDTGKTMGRPWEARPSRDDMDFFVRAAAGLYELAKQLHRLGPLARRAPPKDMDTWLGILTGHQFSYITDPNLLKGVIDIHVSEDAKQVTVAFPGPDAKTAKELEDGRATDDQRLERDCIDVEARGGEAEEAGRGQPPPAPGGGPEGPSGKG